MTARVVRWDPCAARGGRWVLDELRMGGGRLVVRVEAEFPPGRVLELSWDSEVFVQARDEGDYLAVSRWGGFEYPHPFYLIEDSPVLERIVGESDGVRTGSSLSHFAIYTTDTCVDVVALEPPAVRWVDDGNG